MDQSSHQGNGMNHPKLTALLPAARLSIHLGEAKYGTPQPEVRIEGIDARTNHRRIHAALHFIAMELEIATSDADGWCVQIDADRGIAYLELARADEAEIKRGMALLQAVFG
jgi:hypothetical protein